MAVQERNLTMLLAMTQAGLMPSPKLQKEMERERANKEAYKAKKKAELQLMLDEEEAYKINRTLK